MNELKRIVNLLNKISELEKYKKMWERLECWNTPSDFENGDLIEKMQEIERELKQ